MYICITSFRQHNNPRREEVLSSLLHRSGRWDSETLNDFARSPSWKRWKCSNRGCPTPGASLTWGLCYCRRLHFVFWAWAAHKGSDTSGPGALPGTFSVMSHPSKGVRIPPTPLPKHLSANGLPFLYQKCTVLLQKLNLQWFACIC